MPDITEQLKFATSTPQEAAENITDSKAFSLAPDVYKESKVNLKPELDLLKKPSEATPGVARYVAQSPEHAALAQNDIPKLNDIEKIIKFAGDQVGGVRQKTELINELALKKMFQPDKFTQGDDERLFELNEEVKSFSDYGASDDQKLIGYMAGGIASMGSTLGKHAKLIAAGTGVGALLGAGGGAVAGGVGAIPGAIAGGGTGLWRSTMAAMAIDGANQQMGSVYNELDNMTLPDGRAIDEDTKRYTAMGVGVTTGVIVGLVGHSVAKTVPFLNTFLNPKLASKLVSDPTRAALTKSLFNIGKSVAAGGSGSGLQRTLEIFSTEFAANYDGNSEGSFLNALTVAGQKLAERSGELKQATLVGGGVTGAITGVTSATGFSKTKKQFKTAMDAADNQRFDNAKDVTPQAPLELEAPPKPAPSDITPPKPKGGGTPPQDPQGKAVQILRVDEMFDEVIKKSKSTEMRNLAPHEFNAVMKQMLDDVGIKKVWIDKEDAVLWAQNEQMGARARGIIDPTGAAMAAYNVPIAVPAHEWLDIIAEYPEAADIYKLSPEGPTVALAKKYLEEQQAAAEQRQAVSDKLGVSEANPESTQALANTLDPEQPGRMYPSNDVYGEADYLDDSGLRKAAEMFMSPDQLESYLEAQGRAKQSVVDAINETAKWEMDQVVDLNLENALEMEREHQLQRLENNPNFAIVDKFTKDFEFKKVTRFNTLEEMTAAHAKPGYSPFAIDPRVLTDEQKAMFLKNDQLKKHKVFVRGGMHPDESARFFGVRDGETLLKILSETPTREEVVARRTAEKQAFIEKEIRENTPLNETALSKAYDATLTNALETMKHMRNKEWAALKGGFKKIALTPPTKEEITVEARKIVAGLKVSELDVNQFKVGYRKSQRMAVDAILKNQPEKAFVNQRAVALNIALAKETHLKIGEVNRVRRLAKKFDRRDVQQELQDAGELYVKGANEILDVFNLNPNKKGQGERGAYLKYVEESIANGDGVVEIPKRFSDVRQSVDEMSVEQTLAIGDALKNLLHNARWKNKLFKKHENIKAIQTIEGFANLIHKELSVHPDYDPKRNDIVQKSQLTESEKFGRKFIAGVNMMEKVQHQIRHLENGKVVGPINDLIWRRIVDANEAEKTLGMETFKQLEKLIDIFGKEEFEAMVTQDLVIKEFKNSPTLNGGKLTKLDLFQMLLNTGNSGNWEELIKFGPSKEVFMSIFEEHLDHKHMELAQRHWDIFKSFEPKIVELEKRTEGIDVQLVKAEPVVFKGRVYPGGYFPILSLKDDVRVAAERMEGAANINRLQKIAQRTYAKAQTEQGHLEARVGNKSHLDLDYGRVSHSIAQHIHDLTHREAIRDVSKILSYKPIREDIVAVLGQTAYGDITDMVIAVADAREEYSRVNGMMRSTIQYLSGGVQTVMIAGKATSVMMQPVSLVQAIDIMGTVNGTKHMTLTAAKFANNPHLWGKFFEFAAELHPAIRDAAEGNESDIYHKLKELVPEKGTPGLSLLTSTMEWGRELAFNALGQVDLMNKVMVVLSGYSQAISGDVDGIAAGDHAAAQRYASNLAELTQTHTNVRNLSPLQREKLAKPMILFFNDLNTAFNTTLRQVRVAKSKLKAANALLGEGGGGQRGGGDGANLLPSSPDAPNRDDMNAASKALGTGVGGFMKHTLMVLVASGLYNSMVHGDWSFFEDDKDLEGWSEVKSKFQKAGDYAADSAIGTIPVVRSIYYSAFSKYWEKSKTVVEPLNRVANDTATMLAGLKNALDTSEEMTKQQKRAAFYVGGYLLGYPADTIYKTQKIFTKDNMDVVSEKSGISELLKTVSSFIKKREEDGKVSQEYLEQLKELKEELDPQQKSSSLPERTLEIIKQIESKGDVFAFNPNSSAAGVYQFTEGTWNSIREQAPELGLTENGRISSNPEQQERAMEWLTKENAKALEGAGIDSNIDNLYAAHFLGVTKAIQILKATGDTKLKTLLSENVMQANGLASGMKVKEFKDWLMQKTIEAESEVERISANNG